MNCVRVMLGVAVVSAASPGFGINHLDSLHFRFEEHRGTPGKAERFVARGAGYALSLFPGGSSLVKLSGGGRTAFVQANLVGGSPVATPLGIEPLPGKTHYLTGNDTALWRPDVPAFARVQYRDVYRGIDLIYYGQERRLEYDFVVAPGADPGVVRFQIAGARRVSTDSAGDLVIATDAGDMQWKKPVVYQMIAGKRVAVEGNFLLHRRGEVGFHIGAYDRRAPLVIDPVLNYASYVGGKGNEAARGIAVDSAGNIYIAGFTTSTDLPGTGGTVQSTYGGEVAMHQSTGDAFVAKITPAGALAYCTYFGGNADDVALGLALDSTGNVYVTGYTNSQNFRTTAGVVQPTFVGQGRGSTYHEGGDAFVLKLNAAGSNILYSTFLGGSLDDRGVAIAVDGAGNAYVAGQTISTNFPVSSNAIQTNYAGGVTTEFFAGGDAFVSKLNPTASQLIYSTYLGGKGSDAPGAIAVDSAGNAYVGGATTSADFKVTTGALQTTYGGASDTSAQPIYTMGDGFISKLNPTGTALVYSTYLGGKRDDGIAGLAIDGTGAVYVTGSTSSTDFPVSAGGAQRTYGGPGSASGYLMVGDGFISKLNTAGSGLVYSTYFGGNADDMGWAIAVDAAGNAHVGGQSNSTDFKVSEDALQKTFGGRGGQSQPVGDGVFLKVNPTGSAFLYASYLGGSGDDAVAGVALDSAGNAYLTGSTASANFATSTTAAVKTYGGRGTSGIVAGDAFVARITELTPPVAVEPDTKVTGVANAASYASSAVSPGEIVVIYGQKIGPDALVKAGVDATGLLDKTVAGTRILFDGNPAPIVYVFGTQSAAIVPYAVAGKQSTQVQVEYQGVKSTAFTIPVAAAVPGLFSADSSGTGQGAIFNQDSTPNSVSNPADPDSIVVFFGTGEGQTVPPGVDGKVATEVFPKPAVIPTVTIGGLPTDPLLYYGAVPFQVAGLFQINAKVPAALKTGNHEVIVSFGAAKTQQRFTVAVK
jgi:uncharacterized protein (TIGR03437 family)